jgi:hypothetical protein
LLAGARRRARRIAGIGPGIGDGNAGDDCRWLGDRRRLRRGAADGRREHADDEQWPAHDRVSCGSCRRDSATIILAWNPGGNALNEARAKLRAVPDRGRSKGKDPCGGAIWDRRDMVELPNRPSLVGAHSSVGRAADS